MRLAALLVGLLTLGQEVDRLVDMLRYEEAGVIVDGHLVRCEVVQPISGGGIRLARCRPMGPYRFGL